MRRLGAIVLMVLGLAFTAQAGSSPQALVEDTAELILAKLKEEEAVIKAEPGRIYELVDEIVLPHFDFEYMAQLVLAKHWRRVSAAQRQAFIKEFKMLLVRTYATSLNEYTDQEIIYLPFRASSREGMAVVRSEIDQPGGFPIPIDYKLRAKTEDWKVFDVVIDGVSLVTNYRSSFSKEIRQAGMDALIKTLAQRNIEASQ